MTNFENLYLRKHDNGEMFGPVAFEKIKEWARSAQVAPQDMLSDDQEVWTKAPMVAELEMDWLVELDDELLYGPTTAETLLEFLRNGEISGDTNVINSCTGERFVLRETPFYTETPPAGPEPIAPDNPLLALIRAPKTTGIRMNLQQRIRDLEIKVVEKQRLLNNAQASVERLEARVKELEERIREFSGFKKG